MPICPDLALKCYFYALLAQIMPHGFFGCPTDVESRPMGKVDAPGVKTSVPTLETDSVSGFYYILKLSN